MKIDNLFIAVFSYNRGEFLKNCVESIERNLLSKNLFIYDDGSNEKQTLAILKDLSKKYYVSINKKNNKLSERGGLYYNINKAIEHAIEKNFIYILLIQEDAQVVRRVDDHFLNEIENIFQKKKDIFMVYPFFLKNDQKNRKIKYNAILNYYYDEDVIYASYDQGIYSLNRIIEKKWKFRNGEDLNTIKAKELKLKYVINKNPSMMFLPNVKIKRRDSSYKKTILIILELLLGMGFYPYKNMTEKETTKFLSRKIQELPFAENYLNTIKKTKQPWRHSRSDYPLVAAYLFLKNLILKK